MHPAPAYAGSPASQTTPMGTSALGRVETPTPRRFLGPRTPRRNFPQPFSFAVVGELGGSP